MAKKNHKKDRKGPAAAASASTAADVPVIATPTGIPVRRNKKRNEWYIADAERIWFVGHFASGLLLNVRFVHKAEPMACVPGYDSTGEAIGTELQNGVTEMPADATRIAEVVYDPENRQFHEKGTPETAVDQADYLVCCTDGSALGGWKEVAAA